MAMRGIMGIFEIYFKNILFFYYLSFFLSRARLSVFCARSFSKKTAKSFLETKFRLNGVTTVCIKALLPRVYIGRSASERRQSE